MIVTTSTRRQSDLYSAGKKLAQQLNKQFVPRRRAALEELFDTYQVSQVLMLTTEGCKLFFQGQKDPFFFHPSSAMFRLKRLMRGEHDPFVQCAQLTEGMSVLDCTLGLASDAIVASFVVGQSGTVVGLESVPIVAYLLSQGLQTWQSDLPELNAAMRNIQVIGQEHGQFLKQAEEKSFDVVYFDPMFASSIDKSSGIAPLKQLADYQALSEEMVREAQRVARQRVVLKDSSYSESFAQLGFSPIQRKYASHWFGSLEVGK